MKRALLASILSAALAYASATAHAVSNVFSGDPINPSTGLPYEILPGFPLVMPGPDGVIGTADDVVDASVIGDIDMVVRSGSPAATATIPPPTAQGGRAALPLGVAGSTAGGGTEIPFTVFLSDGAVDALAPAGHLLPAADMDGIPVVVTAFGDFDGDGFIGPTNQDAAGATDNRFEVEELTQVGRAVALFSGGVARGAVAIHAGRPASQGGLTVVLTALAVTGPFSPSFFGGNIPSGPAIASALPFFPQRDLAKLIRDRAVPAGPNTTLQQVVDFVMLPSPNASVPFALPTDGSSPTIDVALVKSQTAVRAAFREDARGHALPLPVGDLVLGTQAPANHRALRLVPVDRWGNPADPAPALTLSLHGTGPLDVILPTRARRGELIDLGSARGVRVVVRTQRGTPDGSTGTLAIEHDGVVVGALPYRIDAGANQPQADVVVPSQAATTIQAGIDQVTDRNHDGALVVAVRPGLYHENVVVNRPIVLRGAGAGTTILEGDGSANVVSVNAPNSTLQGLTTVGGGNGFALSGGSTLLIDSSAWHNLRAGIAISGAASKVVRNRAAENGIDGMSINGAGGAVCSGNLLFNNGGTGAALSGAQSAQLDNNVFATNAGGGVSLTSTTASNIIDNQIGDNVAPGIQLLGSQSCQVIGNLVTVNDDDGVRIDAKAGETGGRVVQRGGNPASDNLISGNTVDLNHGYGLFVRRSPDDDFSAAPGLQPPPGDNTVSSNRKGDVVVRPN
jgi:parallel beta-helix repeat protein